MFAIVLFVCSKTSCLAFNQRKFLLNKIYFLFPVLLKFKKTCKSLCVYKKYTKNLYEQNSLTKMQKELRRLKYSNENEKISSFVSILNLLFLLNLDKL